MSCQPPAYRPPVACAAALDGVRDGGGRCPAACQSSAAQPNSWTQRAEVERDVGDPAADHDVRARGQRLDDPLAAGVDVGVGELCRARSTAAAPVSMLAKPMPSAMSVVDAAAHVVAGTTPMRVPSSPSSLHSRATASAQARGFAPPALVTMRMPFSRQAGSSARRKSSDVAWCSPASGSRPALGQDRHRELGQVVAAQVVDVAAVDHVAGRREAVAPERHAGPQAHALHPDVPPISRL